MPFINPGAAICCLGVYIGKLGVLVYEKVIKPFVNIILKVWTKIENIFKKKNYRINNVILGGTNLAGCVLRSKPYSAIHWARRGYHTQIYLPLCADYQLPGINQVERNLHATSILYNVIREERLWDKIDLVRMKNRLIIK